MKPNHLLRTTPARGTVVVLAFAGMFLSLPHAGHAQRVVDSGVAPSSAGVLSLPSLALSSASSLQRSDSVSRSYVAQVPDAPRRPRGPIALRGLLVGAVVGGAVGYVFGREDEYGGAVLGPIFGAIIGAPVGMLALLLVTPE